MLGRNANRERSLTAASERRLTRFGFDLHDGPMQDIAALAADLRLFRRQLAPLLENSKDSVVALGRIDDLEARLVSVDKELRGLARSLQSPAGLRIPLEEAIKHEVDSLRSRSTIDAELSLSGNFEGLTASQKITLMRILQESLSNVRDHSEAASVKVRLTATRSRLGLEVMDDGRGFDVEERLLQAARAGRLGLVVLAILVVFWFNPRTGALNSKSNAHKVAVMLRNQLRPGDLVVVAHPEQGPLMHYYLGGADRLRWVNIAGPVADPSMFDWRDVLHRLHEAKARPTEDAYVRSLRPGQRMLMVFPVVRTASWGAPWTHLVKRRAWQWQHVLRRDHRLLRLNSIPRLEQNKPHPRGVRTVLYERR